MKTGRTLIDPERHFARQIVETIATLQRNGYSIANPDHFEGVVREVRRDLRERLDALQREVQQAQSHLSVAAEYDASVKAWMTRTSALLETDR